jgi:Flp pilus assembly protein TadD
MHRAGLIAEARERDWTHLPEMLGYIASREHDPVFAASLIRLLRASGDERRLHVFTAALGDPSPLVRSAAADALAFPRDAETVRALLQATEDERRVVRIRAASSLAAIPRSLLSPEDQTRLLRATEELEASLWVRPDDWASHYNRGNFHLERGEIDDSLEAYAVALDLNPEAVPVLANASMAWAQRGELASAEATLQRAREIEPGSDVVNFNLGLLLAEMGRPGEAEVCLRAALESNPDLAAAAHNLAVLIAEKQPEEAIAWSRRSVDLRPAEPRYAQTLSLFLWRAGRADEARRVLRQALDQPLTPEQRAQMEWALDSTEHGTID